MTLIKAAAVQLSPVLYSRDGTLDKVCRQILALGREGVQFATFPETVVPYYPYFCFVQPPRSALRSFSSGEIFAICASLSHPVALTTKQPLSSA